MSDTNKQIPLDTNTIVSIRDQIEFGDKAVRRGRILGWHISTGLTEEQEELFGDIEPQLEYQVELLGNQDTHWIPADSVLGFLRGV